MILSGFSHPKRKKPVAVGLYKAPGGAPYRNGITLAANIILKAMWAAVLGRPHAYPSCVYGCLVQGRRSLSYER